VDKGMFRTSILSSVARIARLSRKIGVRSALTVERALRKQHALADARLVQLVLPEFPNPIYLRPGTCDMDIFFQVILNGEYDFRSFPQSGKIDAIYRQAKAEGKRPLIIDCGANIGLSAVWFSRLFPEAQILAIEPSPDNIAIAKQNLRAYPNVMLLQGAVWDHSTNLKISETGVDPWAYQVVEVGEEYGKNSSNLLKIFTIADLIELADTDEALIVKIDIEGAEESLFRSNTDWVATTALIAIELHDWMFPKRHASARFIRSFANLDFDLVQSGETIFVFIDRPIRLIEIPSPVPMTKVHVEADQNTKSHRKSSR
jgi:FkbM family methyltransferase